MEKKIIKYRWWIIAISVVFTLATSTVLFNLKIDPDLKNYFPKTMTSMVNTNRIEEIFGNQDMILMIFETEDILAAETLNRVKAVEKQISQINGVRRTSSLFGSNRIHGEDGVMYVEPTVIRIPANDKQKEELRDMIRENELVYKVMVSDDFRATAIMATLEKGADEDAVFVEIHSILEEHPGLEKIHFGGLPYLRQAIDKDIKRDALILVPIALLMMLIFLYLVFRQWRGVWLPFLVVVLSALLGLSMIPILGWKFYIITLLVPILLIAVANDYGIHMIAKYQEMAGNGDKADMKVLAGRIIKNLWKPISLTGLTTIAGISALWAHSMIPARQMAVVASIGIFFSIFFSLVLLPALLSLLKPTSPRSGLVHQGISNKRNPLGRFAFFVVRRSKVIPYVALAFTLLITTGIPFLRVDSNEENFFPDKHKVKQAATIINSKFGGSESISVLFKGDMLDPALLSRMETYRSELEKMDAIDLTMSFSGVIREISKAVNDPGDPLYDRIPPTRDGVAQYMELYSMSGDPEELEQIVDFNYEHALLMVRINDANNETVNGIIDRLEVLTAGDQSVDVIGGYGYVRSELANKVQTGTIYSLGIAFLLIFILLSLIFRSASAGVLGIIPLTISVLILFGLMGLTGVRLDVATALLSSVMIGVGVDYSIHFLWRYKEERMQSRPPREAVITTITTTGRGIVFNALSVIVGFVVLIISSFTPIRFFGILVVVSILGCLVGALVILPAIILRFEPKFLRPLPLESEKSKVEWSGIRTARRIAVILLIAAFTAIGASAQNPVDIIRKSHDVVKVSSFEATSTLTISDSKNNQRIRENSMASVTEPDGTEKRIIKFISPAEVKGTGILIFDYPEKSDDMWIYLPALRKTRRIVSKEKSKSFMGSEFSNANITAPGIVDFNYELKGEEVLNGNNCFMIESIPNSATLEDEYGYARSISWIDKNSYLVHQTLYYDLDGELFKTITNKEFKQLEGGKYMVTRMEAQNHSNNRSSEMIMNQVAVSTTDKSYFTVAYLEKE